MTTEHLGAMNLAESSNDDSMAQNDAVVTFASHTGPVIFLCLIALLSMVLIILRCHRNSVTDNRQSVRLMSVISALEH